MRVLLLCSFLSASFGQVEALSQSSNTDLCFWSPLLAPNPLCQISKDANRLPRSHAGVKTAQEKRSTNSSHTGWEGPRHCMGKYCVWANRDFAGGIAVITTPENARRISKLPSISSLEPGETSFPNFEVKNVPGKGVGLVANKTIKRGERVMAWQPTFLMHHDLVKELGREPQHRILDLALHKLPAPRRRAFTRQLGQFGGHQVSDIMATNSFQMDVGGNDGHHLGNFPDVSRFNHDCRPNVAFRIDEHLTHYTHAVRDIDVGEELTITYMNPFETWLARQSHIEKSWGFVCTCKHCSMPEQEIEESDQRLEEIEEIEAELGDFTSKRASAKMIERLLNIYETERLHAKIHGAYVLAALNYNLFGNARKAKTYAQLAAESGIVEFGPDAGDVKAMQALAENPKQHWSWRKKIGG